ncbi:response regulator transcription factor [Rossellomorea marisflavi]|uniref:response regulator n=1 Tax=Rossellomorea marisflavi TaxID=189381 RepID=UPI00203CBF28|nr:response regulator transcription factor [Rossellomorea marisflavi]MCM2605943.1 response regulator transcription factor [Rossellomorea marisflavi]
MKRIMIVEDQGIVRQGLKMMIEQDPAFKVVAEASNGREALEKMDLHALDLILMDIRMPEMNGIEATRAIKAGWPQVKVLMLTTFNDDEYAMQALKEGANGFLLKTSDGEQLLHSVHSCLNGGMTIHDEVAAKVVPRLLSTRKETPPTHSLTPRELSITKLVGEGKTNKEIADQLFLSLGTVKNHISQILQKLELRDRTQLAIYAVRHDIA